MPKATETPTTSRRTLLFGGSALSLGAGLAGLAGGNPLPALAAEGAAETTGGLRMLAEAAQHTLSSDARRGAVDVPADCAVAWAVLASVLAMLNAGRLA